MKNLNKILFFIVIAFLAFYFACTRIIPEFYYPEGENLSDNSVEQYEKYRQANLYYMIFSDSFYPGTEKLMENKPHEGRRDIILK